MLHFQRVLALLLVLPICSCTTHEDVDDFKADNPFTGVTLGIMVPAGYDLRTSWQIELDEWKARSDAAYHLQEYDVQKFDTQKNDAERSGLSLVEQLETGASETPATLVVFPITQIAELAVDNRIVPIPDEIQSNENLAWIDLFQGLREGPGSIADRPSVLPLSSPVLVCYYRQDLFEREGLSPPETWQEYETLLAALDKKGFAVVEPWDEDFRATMFFARAVAHAKHPHHYSLFFDSHTGQPLIDGPGFVRALEQSGTAVELMRKRTDVTMLSPADCLGQFMAANAAMAVTFETGLDESPLERAESMAVGVVRLPGAPKAYNRSTEKWETPRDGKINRCTLTAFSGLCAGVLGRGSEKEQQAAWNLLSQLAVETNSLVRVFPGDTKSPCRSSHSKRPDAWVGGHLSSSEARQYFDVVAGSLRDTRLVAELPVIGRRQFRRALSAGIGRFLSSELTAEETLQNVAREWSSIAADVGQLRVIDSYRISLGLRPKDD